MSVSRGLPPLPETLADITDEQCKAARRTVAAHAIDVTDAIELMCMLGIAPGQEASERLSDQVWSEVFNG